MRRIVFSLGVVCAVALLVPAAAHAQAAIAGSVTDSTGAALPGVTVEASSPALIEKARTVVTDGAGQYRIVDLSPGTYSVVFSLSGFKTVRRTDIVLEGTFTAQVNIGLEVGSVEETITVTGAAPTVDVVSNTQVQVMNREVLDAIPTPTRNTPGRALLLPGTTVTAFVLGQFNVSVRGSATSDFTIAIDGLRVNNLCGSGQYSGFYMNDASVQEVTYTTAAGSAEVSASGLRVNSIPKDGGNTFSGSLFADSTGSPLQADNRDADLKAFTAFQNEPPGIDYDWVVNPSFGGPIVRDRLWFYTTYKHQKTKTNVAATYANGDQAFRQWTGYSAVGRLTYQATSRDKFRVYVERQANGEDFNGFATYVNVSPEAATDAWGGGWVPQVKWTQTTTNRLLLEAGISYYRQPYWQRRNHLVQPNALANLELTTVRITNAPGAFTPTYESLTKDFSSAASASYVTGSHAFKVGMTMLWGENQNTGTMPFSIDRLNFFQGNPAQIVVNNSPRTSRQNVNADLGVYAQDSWTMNRLTLNLGGRYDYFNSEVPAQSAPAGPFIAARDFAAIKNVPNWHDWAVRFAASYDLFGTGKTALKFSSGKYLASQAAGYAANFNPLANATETRTWRDSPLLGGNGDRTVINPDGSIQFNEIIGGTSNFGQITDFPDPDLKRGYNWEYNVTVDHELVPRVRVSAGYYRRVFYNLAITDNENLDPNSDWTSFEFVIPPDSRLPDAGETITLYTLNQTKVGTPTRNLRTYSVGTFGPKNFSTYNGFEVSANARVGDKLLAFGGINLDKSQSDNCDQPDNPNSRRFCDAPGRMRTTVKASAVYRLPWEVQLSGTFLGRPGGSISANYTINQAVAGRPIIGGTSGASSFSINLIQPNTLFLPYQNQLDARVTKSFRVSRYRAQLFMDVFNVFNANTTTSINSNFGPSWQVPQAILQGRYLRFGTQWNF